MEVLLTVPDDIVERLQVPSEDLPRHALESLAAEFYRARLLSAAEVQRMLGFETRWQTDEFLKQREAYLRYSVEDLDRDIETFRRLSGR
jgi:predicted HTH domain antitoxin